MMHTDTALYDALGQWMHNLSIANYAPHGRAGIPDLFVGAMPDTPDDAVTLNVYDSSIDRDDTGNPDYWVQFRFRAEGTDPRRVSDMADLLATHLLDATHLDLAPGVRVRHANRTVRTPLGADANRRYERADSYRLSLTPPQH